MRIDGYVFEGSTSNASTSGLGLRLQQPSGSAMVSFPKSTPIEDKLLARNAQLHGHLQSCRCTHSGELSLGLSYTHQNEAQERQAIDLAFGSSDTLVQNNQRRHAGRSVVGGLLTLFRFAFTGGISHLVFLSRLVWRKSGVTVGEWVERAVGRVDARLEPQGKGPEMDFDAQAIGLEDRSDDHDDGSPALGALSADPLSQRWHGTLSPQPSAGSMAPAGYP